MPNSVRINRRWLDQLVYQVASLDGHLTPAVGVSPILTFGSGAGVVGSDVRLDGRTLTIGLDVRPVSFAGRQTTLDALKAALSGLLEVETFDQPARVWYAALQSATVEPTARTPAILSVWVQVVLLAADPAPEDIEPTLLTLSTTRQPCPIGTDTSAPVIELAGGCTNPAIVLRNSAGAEVARTTFGVVLGTNDALRIDARTGTIERWVAGVRQTGAQHGLAAYESGPLPLLSPEDGACTIELAATGGTPVGSLEYRRRW